MRSTTGNVTARLLAAVTTAILVAVAIPRPASAEAPAAQAALGALTGGKQLKVVWNQDNKVKYYDSKKGDIVDLPFPAGSAPLLSLDGERVFVSIGQAPAERSVVMYDTATDKVAELAKGPGNNLLAVWKDPKSEQEWVYVNEAGDKAEAWNVPTGAVSRFPVDKPEARELFWDRTSSHMYLMFSADGTRACFEPSWANIGQLALAYGPDGKVNQDKSMFKTFGGGCFPSLAPDNSYRLFRLEGDHRAITMHDADGGNARKIATAEMPGVKEVNGQTWLTRWSTHPRFMTCMAPDGEKARIWLLRFDAGFTRIEGAAPVANEGGPKCWNSHAWIDPGTKATGKGKGKTKTKPAGKNKKKDEKKDEE